MNKILVGMLCSSLMLGLASCGEDAGKGMTATGRISPTVEVSRLVVTAESRSEKAEPEATETSETSGIYENHRNHLNTITADQLKLTLKDGEGNVVGTWPSLSEFPADEEFRVGSYTLEASLGDETTEGFEKPYFFGSTTLTVAENKTTSADLKALLANAGVAVTFTEKFQGYFSDYKITLQSAKGTSPQVLTKDETRPLYVLAGNVKMTLTATRPNGQLYEVSIGNFTAVANTIHGISLDLDGEFGKTSITVTFDDTITGTDPITIDLSEELTEPEAPYMTATGFANGDNITFVEKNMPSDIDPAIHITSKGGLKSATLTIDGKGYELLNATDAAELTGLGMKLIGMEAGAKMARIDFGGYLNLLSVADNKTSIGKSFSLTVTDANDKTVETPIGFSCTVNKLVYKLLSLQQNIPSEPGAEAAGTFSYNGIDPNGSIVVKVFTERGTYDVLTPTFTPGSSAGEFTFSVPVPAMREVTVGLACKSTEGSSASSSTVAPTTTATTNRLCPAFKLVAQDNDIYTKEGVLKAEVSDKASASLFLDYLKDLQAGKITAQFTTTASGATATSRMVGDELYVDVKSITPSDTPSSIKVTFTLAGCKGEGTFTPEAATQLPNSGFDEWTSEKKGDLQYLWKTSNWETQNILTTSTSGSGIGSAAIIGGCSYKATSGTIPANGRSTQSFADGGLVGTVKHSDGHTTGNANLHSNKQKSGSNAALVRTVGWGSGNKASASSGEFGTCQNKTSGELKMEGYAFASRPSALSFYYHYDVVKSGNGDYGTVEVIIYDNAGNVLAKNNMNLTEQSSYKQITLPLSYTKVGKAAKISVKFVSSANSKALEQDTKYWNVPGARNTSGGEYVGSELYVDDIELIYNR